MGNSSAPSSSCAKQEQLTAIQVHASAAASLWRRHFKAADVLTNFSMRTLQQANKKDLFANLTIRQLTFTAIVRDAVEVNPEGLLLKELAERATVSPSSASSMVDSLVRKKILQRTPCTDDRRMVRITLHEDMDNYFKGLNDVLKKQFKELEPILGEQNLENWLKTMNTVIEFFEKKLQIMP